MISSVKNPRIKRAIELKNSAKARREAGLFIVEGGRMAAELPWERTEKVYISESALARWSGILDVSHVAVETVSDAVFSAMSDTKAPQGILALVRRYSYSIEDFFPEQNDSMAGAGGSSPPNSLILVLEEIRDPGNLGTIFRAGEAAGVTGILMGKGTVDIYNPKVVRSTMGSIFRVPFCYADDLGEAVRELKRRRVRIFAAHLSAEKDYWQADYRGGCAFLVGNEAHGLSGEITGIADENVKIAMLGKVESLNAAVASSLLAFEALRQRRQASGV